MPMKPELQQQFDEQTAVLAALNAGLITAADEDKPLIEEWIKTYESALADPAYQDDHDPSEPLNAAELIIAKVIGADGKRWHAEVRYRESQTASYNGIWYRALADVAVGIPPDDVFDYDAGTGGWIPTDYTPDSPSDA